MNDQKELVHRKVFSEINPRHSVTVWGLDDLFFEKSELFLVLFNMKNNKIIEWKSLGNYRHVGMGANVCFNRILDGEELAKIKAISIVQECFHLHCLNGVKRTS